MLIDSADFVDQREAEGVACGICENETMGGIRLMVKTAGSGAHRPYPCLFKIVHKEVDVDQRWVLGSTRCPVVLHSHELQPSSLTAHRCPLRLVDKSDFPPVRSAWNAARAAGSGQANVVEL